MNPRIMGFYGIFTRNSTLNELLNILDCHNLLERLTEVSSSNPSFFVEIILWEPKVFGQRKFLSLPSSNFFDWLEMIFIDAFSFVIAFSSYNKF